MASEKGETNQLSDERSTVVETTLGEKIFNTKEVADYFKVSEPTVRDWINRGEMRAIRLGGKSWFVPASALQRTIKEKAMEQEEDLQYKRAEAALRATLKLRAEIEPDRNWAISRCISCGLSLVLATRRNRLDGDLLCNLCQARTGSSGLTKDACDRAVEVEIRERNAIAEEELPSWELDDRDAMRAAGRQVESVREWVRYNCPDCDKPSTISIRALFDHGNHIGYCDHDDPFAVRGRSTAHASDSRILRAVAELEARERNIRDGLDPDLDRWWRIYQCVTCNKAAAGKRDIALVGALRCRACHNVIPTPQQRATAIAAAQARGQFLNVETCGSCDNIELTKNESLPWDGFLSTPVLSWCPDHRSVTERLEFAQAYAESREISEATAHWLFRHIVELGADDAAPDAGELLKLTSGRHKPYKRPEPQRQVGGADERPA